MTPTGQHDEYQEILTRLETLKARNPLIPLIDPTANVKSLVELEATHQNELRLMAGRRHDDLRNMEQKFNEKMANVISSAARDEKNAEARRIDALLVANTNNVALALEKQGAAAQAQDKRIAQLEQNQYQGVGAAGQRTEGTASLRWSFEKVLTLMALLIAAATIFYRR